MNNIDRKKILYRIDNDEIVSNIELGMSDLTPYYSEESLMSSLHEKILYLQQSKNEIKHINGKHSFFPLQVKALDFICKHDRIVLSAPTSFGKTLIIKEYIYIQNPKHIVFIVPTNALAYELVKSFKSNHNFSEYTIFDKSTNVENKIEDEYLLYIGTQEKYLEVKELFNKKIDLFIIDEAYKLEEDTSKQRGFKLSSSFMDSITCNSNKIVLLSPNATFIGFDKYNFDFFETNFNIVDKKFEKMSNKKFYDTLLSKYLETNEKTILYIKSPNSSKTFLSKLNSFEIKDDDNEFIQTLIEDFHEEWSIVKLLKKGVVSHNGRMPKFVQNKMIELFLNEEKYNLLIGTNSISEGINTPTKNIFIYPSYKISDNDLLLRNTIGRAGRLGEYPIGYVYSCSDIEETFKKPISIKIALSNEEMKEIVDDSNNHSKIEFFCDIHNISYDFVINIMKSHNMSLSMLSKILNVLKENLDFSTFTHILTLAKICFASEKINDDYNFLKGVLQESYKYNGEYIQINTFQDRVDMFNRKQLENPKIKNPLKISSIVDGYIKMIYSTIDNYLCPIANIATELYGYDNEWIFGLNVMSSIEDFQKRYYRRIYSVADRSLFTDIELKILQILNEYGVSISKMNIDKKIVNEISEHLNVRYSTFDIINVIKKLMDTSVNKSTFRKIYHKYFS